MQLEAARPASAEQSEKETQSIFDFYSIENEIKFIREMDELPEEEKRFYLTENVNRFLGEFVGKVPYTKISYLLKPYGLEYAGFRASRSYEKSLYLGGQREKDEWVGFQKLEKSLFENRRGVTWISPPKSWDYSFVYHFEYDEGTGQVDEYILRYPEAQNSVDRSNEVLQTLHPHMEMTNTSSFLRNPLTSYQPQFDREIIMNALGISFNDIYRSQLFEKKVRSRLSEKIDEYVDTVLRGDINAAHFFLIGIYNAAHQIKLELDSRKEELVRPIYKEESAISDEVFFLFARQKATVVGGGSCPITRAGNSTPLSGFNIAEGLKLGLSVEDIFNKNSCPNCSRESETHFHCPGCGGSIESGKGTATCPHCRLNKDDYARQTGVKC